ncbi:protein of unknown function [Paenibacillaceae bacterium GAS479]|nr:protein of unknown function [Paenibacillaceae bacterium GAS479]
MRYEYKFVKVELKGVFESKPKQDYREIVREHAGEDWRLFQIFAPGTHGYGTATWFELIFERAVRS